jgi:hypothetical protein
LSEGGASLGLGSASLGLGGASLGSSRSSSGAASHAAAAAAEAALKSSARASAERASVASACGSPRHVPCGSGVSARTRRARSRWFSASCTAARAVLACSCCSSACTAPTKVRIGSAAGEPRASASEHTSANRDTNICTVPRRPPGPASNHPGPASDYKRVMSSGPHVATRRDGECRTVVSVHPVGDRPEGAEIGHPSIARRGRRAGAGAW